MEKVVSLRAELSYTPETAQMSFLCERNDNLLLIVLQSQKPRCYNKKFHMWM